MTGFIIADQFAIKERDRLLSGNVILVCSPFGNRFTKHVFDAMAEAGSPTWPRFEEKNNMRYLRAKDGRQFNAGQEISDQAGKRAEYALVARYRNPWAVGKYIFVFAGVQAVGTHAVGELLKREHRYRDLNGSGKNEDLALVVSMAYSGNDAFNFNFDVRDLLHL
jgi:hypothetical protein